MLSTQDICRLARKDPVVSLLVPQECCRSLPVPFAACGSVFMGLYFYPVDGKTGADKRILSPIARITLDTQNGRVVEAVTAPFCHAPGHTAVTQVASYPPQALKGLRQEEADRHYVEYFELCDQLARDLGTDPEASRAASYGPWRNAFERLCEPGFEIYYDSFQERRAASPASFVDVPAAQTPIVRVVDSERIAALDLTPLLKDLDHAIRDLSNDALDQEWSYVRKSITASAFCVGLVGEFLRGKSYVANALLDQALLPVADTPTTALPTRVTFASEPSLLRTSTGGKTETLPLSHDSLHMFTRDTVGSDISQGSLTVRLPCRWLRDQGIELCDTPGVGDASSAAMETVSRIIAKCDATLLCVNATMPLSLTERAFLEDTILARSVPCVAVVATRLDLVPERERTQVMERMIHRLAEWGLRIPVWCVNDVALDEPVAQKVVCGPQGMRNALARWAASHDRLAQRKNQAAAQAKELCGLASAAAEAQIAAAHVSGAPEKANKRSLEEGLDSLGERWGEMTDLIDERELALERKMERDLSDLRQDLQDELGYELSRTRNPREWWEKDLPFRLRRFLKRVKRELQPKITHAVASDTTLLSKKLAEYFATVLEKPEPGSVVVLPDADIIPSPDDLTDLDKIRLWTRIGSGVVTAAGYMLLGAPAMLLSLTGGIAGDRAIGGKIEEQRQRLSLALDDVVDKAMEKIIKGSRNQLRSIYRSLASELDAKKNVWAAAVRKGDQQSAEPEHEVQRLRAITHRLDSIREGFDRFLEGKDT